jgi:hypothetical protein
MLYVVTAGGSSKGDPTPSFGRPSPYIWVCEIFWDFSEPPVLAPPCVGGIVAGMKVAFIALLAVLLCVSAVAQDKPKPLPKDFKSLKALAEKGDAKAQYNLGLMYFHGKGVEKDWKEGIKWIRKAAEQGDVKAHTFLGAVYFSGRGVEKDFKEAVKWYRKAAEQNSALAQYSLGGMYEYGRGVEKDEKEAVKWFRKAAEQGYEPAKLALKQIEK